MQLWNSEHSCVCLCPCFCIFLYLHCSFICLRVCLYVCLCVVGGSGITTQTQSSQREDRISGCYRSVHRSASFVPLSYDWKHSLRAERSAQPWHPVSLWTALVGLPITRVVVLCTTCRLKVLTSSGYPTMVHGRGCNPHRCTRTYANVEITSLWRHWWRHNSETIRDREKRRPPRPMRSSELSNGENRIALRQLLQNRKWRHLCSHDLGSRWKLQKNGSREF